MTAKKRASNMVSLKANPTMDRDRKIPKGPPAIASTADRPKENRLMRNMLRRSVKGRRAKPASNAPAARESATSHVYPVPWLYPSKNVIARATGEITQIAIEQATTFSRESRRTTAGHKR